MVDSEEPTEEINEICPGLAETCCTISEISILHHQVISRYRQITRFGTHLKALVTRILEMGQIQFDRMKKRATAEMCLRGKERMLDLAYGVIWKRGKAVKERVDASINHFTKISSGFMCSLCERDNGANFKTHGHGSKY